MEINTVSILGLGAEGSIVYDALRKKLRCEQIRVLARDERARRLRREGMMEKSPKQGVHPKINGRGVGTYGNSGTIARAALPCK